MPRTPFENKPAGLSPVDAVIRAFGGAAATAMVGLTTDAVRKWKRPLSKGGCGGCIPSRYQARFLEEARVRDLDLTADDLIAEPVQ